MSDEASNSVQHEDVADQVVRTEEAEFLLNAMFELNGDQQQVIYQRFVEGFEYGEIARSIGKSEGAVRAIQHRALRRLRDLLRRQVL
jgi:RNA polymerase sigma-70 factor (ECF subfamily)